MLALARLSQPGLSSQTSTQSDRRKKKELKCGEKSFEEEEKKIERRCLCVTGYAHLTARWRLTVTWRALTLVGFAFLNKLLREKNGRARRGAEKNKKTKKQEAEKIKPNCKTVRSSADHWAVWRCNLLACHANHRLTGRTRRDFIVASMQSHKGVRTCVFLTSNKFCGRWSTPTPLSDIMILSGFG